MSMGSASLRGGEGGEGGVHNYVANLVTANGFADSLLNPCKKGCMKS